MDASREKAIRAFRCPRYEDIPDIGLYLEQALGFVNDAMCPLVGAKERMTGAMVSNYVKNGALEPPVKKRYYRAHLCYLIVMSLLKPVFTVQQMARLFQQQKATYPTETAYIYFCAEFENGLREAFEFTGRPLPSIETARTPQTILVRAMVLAVTNRIYVENMFLGGNDDD